MGAFIDLTGKQFGRLTVLMRDPKQPKKAIKWVCKCACGNIVSACGYSLRYGDTQSCGCYQIEQTGNAARKHGDSNKRLFRIWCGMKERCSKRSQTNYKYYGGRGISVCEEWSDYSSFKEWAISTGYTDTLTLDRIDSNGNYEPHNCRWVPQEQQKLNTRRNKLISYNGKTMTMMEWSKFIGINYSTLRSRINEGHWCIEDALTKDVKNLQR